MEAAWTSETSVSYHSAALPRGSEDSELNILFCFIFIYDTV
jgi:hypothetical protein